MPPYVAAIELNYKGKAKGISIIVLGYILATFRKWTDTNASSHRTTSLASISDAKIHIFFKPNTFFLTEFF